MNWYDKVEIAKEMLIGNIPTRAGYLPHNEKIGRQIEELLNVINSLVAQEKKGKTTVTRRTFNKNNAPKEGTISDGQKKAGKNKSDVAKTATTEKATDEGGKTHTDKVREKLLNIKNTDITNKATGIVARFGVQGINKMLSNTAVNKSINNGFSRDEHLDAVENVKTLFENAILEAVHGDTKNNSKNIKSIKRFLAKIDDSKSALITVKESVVNGHRIYSLELEEIKETPSDKGKSESSTYSDGVNFSESNISQEQENSNNNSQNEPKTTLTQQVSREGVEGKEQRETPLDENKSALERKSEGRNSDDTTTVSKEEIVGEKIRDDFMSKEMSETVNTFLPVIRQKLNQFFLSAKPHKDKKHDSIYGGRTVDELKKKMERLTKSISNLVDTLSDFTADEKQVMKEVLQSRSKKAIDKAIKQIKDSNTKLAVDTTPEGIQKQAKINRKEQLELVKTEFPTATNIKQNKGSISFTLFGERCRVDFVNKIVATEKEREAHRRDYGREMTDSDMILGKTETINGEHIITLLNNGDKDTISHEAFHLAFRTVLTKEQQQLLLDKYGSEEAVAEAYRKLMNKSNARGTMFDMSSKVGRLFQKIYNFARSLYRVFMQGSMQYDAESIMYAVADGSIYELNEENEKGIQAFLHPALLAAWHGTPHLFDSFSTDFMGSGEGVQAHGWGLYFALNKKISEDYASRLSKQHMTFTMFGESYSVTSDNYSIFLQGLYDLKPNSKPFVMAVKNFEKIFQLYETPQELRDYANEVIESDYASERAKEINKEILFLLDNLSDFKVETNGAYLYQVDIPSTDTMLREDKPFSEQPAQVKNIIKTLLKENFTSTTKDIKKIETVISVMPDYFLRQELAKVKNMIVKVQSDERYIQYLKNKYEKNNNVKTLDKIKNREEIAIYNRTDLVKMQADLDKKIDKFFDDWWSNVGKRASGKELYDMLTRLFGSPKEASLNLLENGVQGISYKGGKDGECCVIFNDKAVKILERNGEPVNNTKLMAFAGKKAKNAPLDKLAEAERMEADNATVEEIYEKTGWFKGKDNKWRFEIPDDVDLVDLDILEEDEPMSLDEVYDNDALFEAYPQLRDIQIVRSDLGTDYGAYDPATNTIEINSKYIDDDFVEVAKTVIHEIQHAIQGFENFATGGNAQTAVSEVRKEHDNLMKDLFGDVSFRSLKSQWNKLSKLMDKVNNTKKGVAEKAKSDIAGMIPNKSFEEISDIYNRINNLEKGLDEVFKKAYQKQGDEMYYRLGGEQEAREVEDRAEQRIFTADMSMPQPHQDDAVIVFGGKEFSARSNSSKLERNKNNPMANTSAVQIFDVEGTDLKRAEVTHLFYHVPNNETEADRLHRREAELTKFDTNALHIAGINSIEDIIPQNAIDNLKQIVENKNTERLFWLKDMEVKLMTSKLMNEETEEDRIASLYVLRGELEYVKRLSRTEPTGDAKLFKRLSELCDLDFRSWDRRGQQIREIYQETGEINISHQNHSNNQSGFSNGGTNSRSIPNPHHADNLKKNGDTETRLDKLPKVDYTHLNKAEKAVMSFGKAIGVPVHFVTHYDPNYRGVFTHNGEIFINRKATVPAKDIFIHEFVHWLRAGGNENIYDSLSACLENLNGVSHAKRLNAYRQSIFNGDRMTNDEIIEEMMCDAMSHTATANKLINDIGNITR